MPDKVIELKNIRGLSSSQVEELRGEYGDNSFTTAGEFRFLHILKDIGTEPMFILLAIACSLYFILGKSSEGIMMAAAIVLVSAISLYQEMKSTRALKNLAQFTEPRVTVIRNGQQQIIPVNELVPRDIILLEEGMKVPADAIILQSNDLSINESIITGESLAVEKNETPEKNLLYQGTTVDSGKCVAEISATGNRTELGKIGKAVAAYQPPKTLLQVQVNGFVKKFALFGLAAFLIIFIVNYLHYGAFATSLLFALTLAMSVVPEEIPVAFSSFMALGAYKMSKLGIISRQPQVIENLGSVTVLCLDKTGTITENKMQVKEIYAYEQDAMIDITGTTTLPDEVLFIAALASESDPFDPMEKAILESFDTRNGQPKREDFKIEYEYPLEGHPPMMTHVYQYEKYYLAAAKGSPERILNVCKTGEDDVKKITGYITEMAGKGYRVLGVCSAVFPDNKFPGNQDDFNWKFVGLVALYDPPKKNIAGVLKQIREASIDIKMLTGDYPQTAMNIAWQVGITNPEQFSTGSDIMIMQEEELQQTVKRTSVFARMFPDAKVKVISALKKNGEIVAMTGDGVNDGPALKLADIGIAMGKKGTETAKIASDLILTDDNLDRIVVAVREGRRIFSNLVKALRYIISIHIPIILTASLPLLLGWKYANIFTPIHVIFLELIMGPTCSIFFEREPAEEFGMKTTGKNRKIGLFTLDELLISITQGIIITAGILTLYYIFMNKYSIEETRTVVFTTLIISNVFLTFVNRSFTKNIYYTSRHKNNLVPVILLVSGIFLALLYFSPSVRHLFELAPVSSGEFWLCFAVAFVSVMWFEVYKTGLEK